MNRAKTQTTHKRMRKKRTAIPVQPPKVPFGTYVTPPEIPMLYQKMKTDKKTTGMEKGKKCHFDNTLIEFTMTKNWCCKYAGKSLCTDVQEEESIDVSSPRDNNSPIVS